MCPAAFCGILRGGEAVFLTKREARAILKSCGKTAAVLAAATACSLWVSLLGVSRESVIMVYLLGILFVTILTSGYAYALFTSVASVLLLNYFFTDPKHTFLISNWTDVMLLAFFLITAIVSGTVTSRLQKQMALSHKNEMTARLLYEVAGGFVHATGKQNIVMRGIAYILEHTGCESTVRLSGEEGVYGSDAAIQRLDADAVRAELPIPGMTKTLGTLSVYLQKDALSLNQELVARTVATQLGIALDREYTYEERENIRIAMEREKLRSTLLRAVAHDLRSPLTALSGASALLADKFDDLDPQTQKKLARDISEEIVWLTNLVENILNMTRINESLLVIHKEDEVVDDVVGEAVSHMARLLQGRPFCVHLPDEVVALPMDGKLVAQVIINLLDNAVRHTPPASAISLAVCARADEVEFCVEDVGQGIDESVKDTLFDGFVTLDQRVTDGKRGMGLGLAICKAVVEAHGGRICAENRPEGGARFRFTLPKGEGA